MPQSVSQNTADLLTTDQVIDRLLEDANLRRLAATCVLPAVRFGSSWRFRRSDLEEWIRRQEALRDQIN
jgi:excisionase family DNA binding protein